MTDWQEIETAPRDGAAIDVWRPVVGWEGFYEVSCRGRVRGTDRQSYRSDGTLQTWRGRELRPILNGAGYHVVRLSRPGHRAMVRVHRIVADAFLDLGHTKETVNHKNGVKTDNSVENLEWMTRGENVQHAIDNGLGEYAPPGSGLAHEVRDSLHKMLLSGEAKKRIARTLGIHVVTVRYYAKNPNRLILPLPPGEQE